MAKSYKAYGEIEITDISDSKQLTTVIESKLQRQVIYDPNDKVYLPNYATTNNILTPQLFITGNMDNIITQAKSVSWFYQINSIGTKIPITGNTTDYTLNTTTKQLTIKTNVLQNNISMNYIAEIVYTDPDTEMDVKTISTIELLKITNGVNGIDGDNPVVAVLSNESHTIPADADGLNMNFSGANTEIKIYDGVRDATSEWTITASPSTGITGNLATNSGFIYTVTNMTLDSGYVNFTAKKGLITLTKRFTLTKVRRGITGADGRTPVKGTDYFDGINGQDGKSSFLWVMYSQNANGSGMTETSTNAKYIGLATTQTNTRPTLNTNYTWSLIKGTDGIKGETGTDGKTSYLHIKYSDNGTSFTTNNGETMGAWIGTYVDFTETDSSVFSAYSWMKIKGENGEQGLRGLQGETGSQGIPGIKGTDGKTSYTHIAYATNSTGTSGFSTSESLNKTYIGMYTDFIEEDSNTPSLYNWTLIKGADGTQGIQGVKGTDGLTPYLHIAYANNGAGSVGFSTTDSVGKTYIGQYTDNTPADSETPSKYSWTLIKGDKGDTGERGLQGIQGVDGAQGIQGVKGADGKTPYTHIAYANNITGTSGFSVSDSNRTHIGMYTDFTANDSTDPSLYNWTLVKGADGSQGIQGKAGTDGLTPYLHIAYATNATGTTGFSTTDSVGKTYIGQYTDYTIDDSNTPSLYSWTLIKGDKGDAGSNAQILYLSSDAESMTFDGLNNPNPTTQTISITAKLQNITGTPVFVASPYNQAGTKLTDITLGGTGVTRTLTQAQWLSTFARVVITATLGSLTDKITIVKLSSGANGRDGLDGLDGDDGIAGRDGVNSYTHIAYANNSTGTSGFSTSDGLNKLYIGMYTDSALADSSDPTKYKWTLIKGADGSQGIQGAKGADGRTPYLHIAYATNATGTTGFSVTDSVGKTYIGQYTDYSSADSSTPSAYKWTLIKGEKGDVGEQGLRGLQGADGSQGIQGIKGVDGKTSYTHIAYANNNTGTSGFSVSDSTNKSYIGMYTDFIETDSTTASLYNWTLIKGADGSQGIQGVKGTDGLTPYFHIAYANNSTGSTGFSTTDSDGKTHIGQYTDYVSADSSDPTKYDWTLIKGADGSNGADAIVGYLTNESVTLGASPTGVVSDFSSTSGVFKVFDGLVDKTGTASVVYAKISNTGCTATIGSNGAYSVSAMTTDTATVVMTATYKTVVVTKTLVLSKSKTGTTGTAGEGATSYWLTNSVGVIKRNDAGVYSPTTITVNSLSQTGTSAPKAYAGRFIISETVNGTTWVDKYTSTVNESSKTYAPSAGITSLRVRMYLAGGTTSLVDEQNIPVVADGSDPIFAILTTPLGSIIKNSTGNLTIEANLYKGSTLITPASYKWYKLDTTVSGGWRQLTASVPDGTTGYTGRILTVTPSSITSLATFKVEAIYNGLTYSNMITLTDLSDPISCIIIGSGIYKNGQGTNSYIARLYRNGSEIDVSGTIYLYKWNLLNKDGTLNAGFTATGKTISIPATAFDDTAQLKCDVDDKK